MGEDGALDLASGVARYHAGCLRVIGAQNVALRDVRTTKKAALCVDVGSLTDSTALLTDGEILLSAPSRPRSDDPDLIAEYERQWIVWQRLQDLAAKAAVEAHAREVVYGGPLMHGFLPKARTGRLEPILAPLFMLGVTLRVTDHGAVEVRAVDEPPRFNTVLWRDAVSAEGLTRIVDQGIEAQVDLAAGWDPDRVETLLTAVRAVMPSVDVGLPTDVLERWPEVPGIRERPADAHLELLDAGALFLANRASPYLLADLERIADAPDRYVRAGRPLDVLLRPPSTESRPGLRAPNLDEVVYPFPSNAAQRQVADALDKHEIVVVQGPPGNGKSLTIANLVAHLVAQGQRVLVSSHKTQALTVVRDKLNDTGQRFLFASLIGDGAAAKRELQKQIQDVRAFAAQANPTTLRRQLAEVESRRAANGKAYADLRSDFIDRAQPEQAEAVERHNRCRGVNVLPADDPTLPAGSHANAAAALRHLDHLARERANVWARLRTATAAVSHNLTEAHRILGEFLHQQRARVAASRDAAVKALVAVWQPMIDADPTRIGDASDALHAMRGALLVTLDGPQEFDAGLRLADAPQLLDDVEHGLRDLENAFAEARARAQHRDLVSAQPALRRHVLQQHELLSHFVKKGKARKWLEANAPGAAGIAATEVGDWVSFWDWWSAVRTQASGLAGGLAAEIPERFDPDSVQTVVARAHRATARARAVIAAWAAARRSELPLPIDEALAATDHRSLDVVLRPAEMAVQVARADQHGNTLKRSAALAFLHDDVEQLDALLDQGHWQEADARIAALEEIRDALPALRERRDVLDGPLALLPHTADAVEIAAEQKTDPPSFMPHLEQALAVHADYLRFREIADSDTTDAIAQDLGTVTEQVMQDARRLLGLRIQQRILEGFQRPSFLASLEKFRRAIGASPKRFERFEELKTSPEFDIDVLTRVFPCWIMRPEDACRVFPLRADVFDVVIVDEASQCNPDQVLPLFARARKVVIVGDAKQLSNEDLRRSLSGDANRTLIRAAGLDRLDPHGLFDQTRNSLLELVSQRQQADVFLNEHFRCRPELIAFSNKQFYGNNLTVIRDRRDDRGLPTSLLIREVQLNQPFSTARGAKVNVAEANALVDDLERRLADPRYDGMSFGVLSLFREQVEHIQALIERRIRSSEQERRRLICSTVDGFQGDERDVILYSWRYTAADHGSVFAFTNGGVGEQRINVALTRARHQAIHFVSTPVDHFPPSAANVTGYLQHAVDPQRLLTTAEARTHHEPSGLARVLVTEACEARGLGVVEGYVACGISIDLLVLSHDGSRRVAVFVDAERDPQPPVNMPERVDQDELLKRAGWQVVRLPATTALQHGDQIDRAIDVALRDATPMIINRAAEAAVAQLITYEPPAADDEHLDPEIEPEDRADYHWEVPSVSTRLALGDHVFDSGFEEELYSSLAVFDHIKVVPQWPSRGKSIDLVITDHDGRRLAVEADGGQHHETVSGQLIPEDLDRQALLEDAGWIFHRVAHRDYLSNTKGTIQAVLDALAAQPINAELAAQVWEPLLPLRDDPEHSPDGRGEPQTTQTPTEDSEQTDDATETEELQTPPAEEYRANDRDQPPDDLSKETAGEMTPESDFEPNETGSEDLTTAGDGSRAAPPFTDAPIEIPNRPEYNGASNGLVNFEDVPLGEIAMRIALLVQYHGPIDERALPDALRDARAFEVPSAHERSVRRFAWVAKGKHWIDLVADQWIGDAGLPERDEHYGDWTYAAIVARAAELMVDHDDPYERLLAEVYSGTRVPKLPRSLVGSAIRRAKGT